MSETAGFPSAIGIEAVEWLSDDPSGMTVRITGRWRRRRPDWRGPAMLVIEAEGRRHRIPAMPEPPFLIGLLPGMWRMSFAVPAELVDHLEGHTWLALGAVMAPLALARPGRPAGSEPVPEPASAPDPDPESLVEPDAAVTRMRPPVDRELLAARELRSLEVAAENARRRAREADERAAGLRAQIEALQEELARTREEPERLRAEIAGREHELRLARQDLHAEAAGRSEAEERLAEQARETERLRIRARDLSQREHELERELRRMRRAVDEAQQEAASARATAAGVEAMRSAPEAPGPTAGSAPGWVFPEAVLATEFGLACRPLGAPPRPGPRPSIPTRELALEQALVAAPPSLRPAEPTEDAELATLRLEFEAVSAVLAREREGRQAAASLLAREREARQAAERRVSSLEQDLARQRERSRRALAAIESFRRELQTLRRAEPAQSAQPPPSAAEPRPAIARPDVVPVVPQPPEPQRLESAFEPDRLNAALARLRERHAPEVEEPKPEASEAPGPVEAPEALEAAEASEPAEAPEPAETPEPPEAAEAPEPAEAAEAPEPPSRLATPAGDALPRLFRALVRVDPAAAGRLVLGLLPAQRLAHPRPVAYDLVLGPGACVQVTSGSGRPAIVMAAAPRGDQEVQFRVEGDPMTIARLLSAGPWRARFGRGVARVHGDRGALGALRALVTTPQSLDALVEAGVSLDPALALRLVAEQLGAHAPEPFSIAHRPGPDSPPDAVLHAAPGRAPLVTNASLELPATTTIVCPPEALLGVLIGRSGPGATIRGETRPLALVRRALERA